MARGRRNNFDARKAPFPWFGGKSKAAPAVWAALGDVDHYVEPFAGSCAVLLGRPHEANRAYHSETVNDLDGFVSNFWRALAANPDAVADAASWPVSEADLHARHVAILRWRDSGAADRLAGDAAFHDPVIAGWWAWGLCSWIGGGWGSHCGPWWPDEEGRLVKRAREPGVSRRLPHVTSSKGVNSASLREPGLGEPHPRTMPRLRTWLWLLAARLRHVRVLNGDWRRACTDGSLRTLTVRRQGGVAGVFLDPPYADTAGRKSDIYACEDLQVAHAVREWALERSSVPWLRIVMAGFQGEHGDAFARAGWREVEWYQAGWLTGGMGNNVSQQHRERLWLSPQCLAPDAPDRCTLWAVPNGESS